MTPKIDPGHPSEGYAWPSASRKAHYFRDTRSLCGKWAYFGVVAQAYGDNSDICTACKRALKREAEKEKLNDLKKSGKMEL